MNCWIVANFQTSLDDILLLEIILTFIICNSLPSNQYQIHHKDKNLHLLNLHEKSNETLNYYWYNTGTLNKSTKMSVLGEHSRLYKHSCTQINPLFPVIKSWWFSLRETLTLSILSCFIIIIICFQMYFNRINIMDSLNKIWYRHYNQWNNKCTCVCEPSKSYKRFISHSSS